MSLEKQIKKPTDTNRRILEYLRDPEHANATAVDLANHFRVGLRAVQMRLHYLEDEQFLTRHRANRTEPAQINLTRKAFSLFHNS